MIHVITEANRHLYRPQIWDMFNERRKAFYEKCGWKDLMVFDGCEVDDFDDEKAVYLLALDADLKIEAGVRARPTSDRSILVDKYPQLVGPGAPPLKGPQVWETSRIFTTERYRKRRDRGGRRSRQVGLSSLEVIHAAGGCRAIGTIDLHMFPWAADATGGAMQIAGPPLDYEFGTMVGTWTDFTLGDIERGRDALGHPPSMRISYEVDDEDLRIHGSLAAVQRAVDAACRIGDDLPEPRETGWAHVSALYARADAGTSTMGKVIPFAPIRAERGLLKI